MRNGPLPRTVLDSRSRRWPQRNGWCWAGLAAVLSLACAAGSESVGGPGHRPAEVGSTASAPTEAPLSLDPSIRRGQLANGLRYYIRRNLEPKERASLRLVVDVGSVLESDAERGFAHFVEHMAFNGTRLFEKQALIDYTEKMGMRFGQHSNATTSFDETIYRFDVPTTNREGVHKGLVILQQIASEVLFEPQEVDQERGVIIEEWRRRQGAGMRLLEKTYPLIFQGSRYANRLPIGEKSVLEKAGAAELRAFYQRWYRPDLMAVVAVGDFEEQSVEASIKEIFSPLARPSAQSPRPSYAVPDHGETRVVVAQDKETTSTTVQIIRKLPSRPLITRGDYRRSLVEGLYHRMFHERLNELRRSNPPPFLSAESGTSAFVRTKDGLYQSVSVKQDGILSGLQALAREIERVNRFGFTESELEREKRRQLRRFELMVLEKDKRPSGSLADEITRNFLTGEAMAGVEREAQLVRELLATITLADVNQSASQLRGEDNRLVVVYAPESAKVPEPRELLALVRGISQEKLTPYTDKVSDGPLVEKLAPGTPVKQERKVESIGVTEWRLGNGVRVVVKPTDFRNQQVMFRAFSPGGYSLARMSQLESALHCGGIVPRGGAGRFDTTLLLKALAGKSLRVVPYIDEEEEGFTGGAAPDDLPVLFELVYLYFTSPRRDEEAFARYMESSRERLRRRLADPLALYQDAWSERYFGNHPRRQVPSLSRLERVSLDQALAFYKERFADASDFTFVFVGNVDLGQLKALSEKYLGALPSSGRKESWRDVGVRPPKGKQRFELEGRIADKSTVSLAFAGKTRWSRKEAHTLTTLGQVLTLRLRQILREELGGTYSVNVSAGMSRRPVGTYQVRISFDCAPGAANTLIAAVKKSIARIKTIGVDAADVDKVKASQIRSLEEGLRTNGYWLNSLVSRLRYGTDPQEILDDMKIVRGTSAAALKRSARRYLAGPNLIGVLKPHSPTAQAPSPDRPAAGKTRAVSQAPTVPAP